VGVYLIRHIDKKLVSLCVFFSLLQLFCSDMQDLFSVLCKTLQVILPHPQAKQPLSLGWMLGVLEEALAGCLQKHLEGAQNF
jgi:hypothetical protein